MTSANEDRGEHVITLEGVEYVMRPTWEAIIAFEKGTGRSLVQLAGEANRNELELHAMAVIVAETVRAWGAATNNTSARGFQVDAVIPLILEEGALIVMNRLALMLYMAATGGVTASGEPKAAPISPKTEAAANLQASPAPRSGGSRRSSGKARQ